jgi:AraC family ethanolamine operon transcriptional activator
MTRLTFTEYDAFAEAVRDASMTMRITAREESRWTLQYATVGSIGMQRGYEGGGSIAEGVTRSDGWTFYHQESLPARTNGQVMSTSEVFGAPPGSAFCLACKPRHGWLTVFVPTALLFPSAQQSVFASSAGPRLLKPPPHVTRRFASLVQRFLATTESQPQLLDHPAASDACRQDLLSAAQELFTRDRHPAGRHYTRWRRLTQSTLELGMSRPYQWLPVPELARRTGVPERTLRTAFHRSYGVSPQEYLRIQRLYQARRLLLASDSDQTTVTHVAFGLGFWDLGRFAGAYRTLFGERPSETLRQRGVTSSS